MTRHGARHALLVSASLAALAALALGACSGRRLPPGTPAPEYEAPIVPAWSGEQADAAAPASVSPAAAPPVAPASALGAELSPDAGVR